MIHHASYAYLNDYLRQCLGAQDLLLPNIDVSASACLDSLENSNIDTKGMELFQSNIENEEGCVGDLPAFSWRWEPIEERFVLESQPYAVLFVRKPLSLGAGGMSDGGSSSVEALEHCPRALELFHKLRQAMNLNVTVAPYVELDEGDFELALQSLRSRSRKIIIMSDDCMQIGDSQNDWIIPDPTVLELHPHLKRPTWELLKRWLAET